MVELRPKREGTPIVASEGTGDLRACPEAVCGGVGRDQSVLQTGTTRSREASAPIGVTSDEAENAPRLRVANGEDSHESKPPVKRRVETHTARAQDSEPRFLGDGVPDPGISGCKEPPLQGSSLIPALTGSVWF